MGASPTVKTGLICGVGLLIAIGGLLFYSLFPQILKSQVREKLKLSPTADPYEHWKDIPVPIYSKFYFFNVTNTYDILNFQKKPNVTELGPYTFRQTRNKVNITWYPNGTVSYYQIKRWYFVPELTVGSLNDIITTINVPMVAAAASSKEFGEMFVDVYNSLFDMTNSTVFITKSVDELLFKGYEDSLLLQIRAMGIEIPTTTFGWFHMKNNSDDGLYTIFTGKKSMDYYAHVDVWNGLKNVSIWQPNSSCNEIKGTPGEMWPPFSQSRDKAIELFIPDICRSLSLSYLTDVEKDGISTYRYWLNNTAFDNGKFQESNLCFCKDKNTCLPSGGLDISSCQHGSPTVVSFPHFLYADASYRQKVDGMSPDPIKHQFFIDLEPNLGIPVNANAKLQINILVEGSQQFPSLEKFPEKTFYPMFWFSEGASVDSDTAKKLKFVTKTLPHIVTIVSSVLVVCGGLIVTFSVFFAIRHAKNQKSKKIYTSVQLEVQEPEKPAEKSKMISD